MLEVLKRLRSLLTTSNLLALLVLLVSLFAFLYLQSQSDVNVFSEEGFRHLAASLGRWGPVLYIVLVALAVVVSQIPGIPLTIAAGALWGLLPATLYSIIGSFCGGMIAYFLGRSLGRSAMQVLTGKVLIFDKARGERYLALVILISRALPVFPFDIISYAAGLSGLSVSLYAIATFLGIIPSIFLLTYLGSAFVISLPFALGLSAIAAVTLVAIPVLIRRYNWLGLKDSIRFE